MSSLLMNFRFARCMAVSLASSLTFIAWSHQAHGDVYVPPSGPEIYLNGEIQAGDAQTIADAVLYKHHLHHEPVLHLNSQGGDIAEAIKIAEFVHDTWLKVVVETTHIPNEKYIRRAPSEWEQKYLGIEADEDGEAFLPDTDFSALIVCYSACALIASASPELTYFSPDGSSLGMGFHRPYIAPDFNKSLSAEESQALYESIETKFRDALSSYRLPSAFIDQVMQTDSENIIIVDFNTWIKEFSGRFPWYEEYLLAKCSSEKVEDLAYEESFIERILGREQKNVQEYLELRAKDIRMIIIRERRRQIQKCVKNERMANLAMKIRAHSHLWPVFTNGRFDQDWSPEEVAQYLSSGEYPESALNE